MDQTSIKHSLRGCFQVPSQREIEVLQLISVEYTSKEIAEQLYISKETVNTHRKNLMCKLKVKNVAGLVRKAFELEILSVKAIGAA